MFRQLAKQNPNRLFNLSIERHVLQGLLGNGKEGTRTKMSGQKSLGDYEFKKPTFQWHKALLLQILKDCKSIDGLTDTELYPRFAKRITEHYERKGERPERIPIVDNRLRELASEDRIVRIKGLDGLKHNFHPDNFSAIGLEVLRRFFSEYDLGEWMERTKQ